MNPAPTLRRPGILLVSDVEDLLGRQAETLRTYVREGLLPRPRQCGSAVYWLEDELVDVLRAAPAAAKWTGPDSEAQPTQEGEAEAA